MAIEFNWVEGTTTIKDFVRAFATTFTMADQHAWTLEYPVALGSVENKVILKTTTSTDKTFYLKVERTAEALEHVVMTIGTKVVTLPETSEKDLEEATSSIPARFAWYKNVKDVFIGEWLPIQYWTNFNNDAINIVIQGDPSPDIEPFEHYLTSYAYIGAIESYEGGDADDTYNFGITVSSDIEPTYSNKYGLNTATGVTDVSMVGTRSSMPYQLHTVEFHAANPYMMKNFLQGSNWTHKHHFSEVTLVHAYDRERGKLKNMLIGDRSAIFHLDELVMDKGTANEKVYKAFNINAPYWFVNNSANIFYGIVLRKS